MEKPAEPNARPRTKAEYKSEIDLYLSQMAHMTKRMAEDQQEIEMLRAETDAILADIMQTLMPANTLRRSIVNVLAGAPGHLSFQDADSVDAYVREERLE